MSQNEKKVWRLRSGWDRALRCSDQWPQSVMYWTKALSYIQNNDFPAFAFGWLPHHLEHSSLWVERAVDDNRLLPSWEHQQLDQNALSVFLYKPQGTWSVYININDFSQVCEALQQHSIRHVGVNENSAGNKSPLWATKHKNSPPSLWAKFAQNKWLTNVKQEQQWLCGMFSRYMKQTFTVLGKGLQIHFGIFIAKFCPKSRSCACKEVCSYSEKF